MDEWNLLAQKFAQQRQLAEQERQRQQLAQQYTNAQNNYNNAQAKQTGWLESVLSGIGNSIKNVGDSLYNLAGSGGAAVRDIFTGNAGTGKYQKEWKDYMKESQYGDSNLSDKDYYAKTAGKAVDAAATVSDFIPGLGKAAKVGLNVGQGIASGAAQNYIDNGASVSLEDLLKGATIGGASAGVGQYVGGKLAGRAAGDGLVSKALNSNIGKAAITGAASGATGGALSSTLNGGDLGKTLASAAQGAGRGAAGGATMAGVMGLAGAGLDKLKNKIENPTTPSVEPEVATDIDTDEQKTNMVGRALKNAGKELEAAQTDITRAERRKFGIKDAGETVDTLRKRTGFSSLEDQAEFSKNITGGQNSVMDDIQRYNLSVDADGNPITLRSDQYEVAINDAVGKDWKKSVMGESYDKFRDDLISDIQNEDPITASNWLKKEAQTQRGIAEAKGPTSDVAARKARIYTEVANAIDDLTYSAVPEKNVNRMFDDTIDEFYARAQEAKAAGNKKYANAYTKLAKELENTPRTIADYRTFKKDFVKSSQLADISAGAQSGSLQAGLSKGTNVVNKLLNTALGEPLDRGMAWAGGKLSDLGDVVNGQSTAGLGKVAGKVAGAVGGAVNALGNESLANTALGEAVNRQIARQPGLDTIRNANAQKEAQKAQQDMQNIQTQLDDVTAQQQQTLATPTYANTSNNQLNIINRAMELALNAGDFDSYSKLADIYQQAYKIYGQTTPTSTTTTQTAEKLTDNQTKALTGLNQLNQLAGMTPGAGTVLSGSPLGGIVNMFGGDDYANQAQALALTLGYLQSGANVSKNEAENIGKSYIPTAFDSDAVRQQKLARARELLNNYLYGTQYYQQ